MKNYFKKNWKFLLFVMLGGLIGGYCLGIYSYDSLSEEMLALLQEQNATRELIALSTMIQYGIIFGVVLAAIGILLSEKVHLWKSFNPDKKAILMTSITPVILIRCFLFNGGLGLAFGHLYRKYGIGYAMIAHGMAHLISDILMIIFV